MDSELMALRTPTEILEAALEKEQKAFAFYSDLLNHASVDIVRDIVQMLKNEEYRHIHLVEKKLAELRLG